MVARPRREPAEPQGLQLPAHGRFAHGNAGFLPEPPRQILQAPADHPVDSRDRAALDDARQRPAMVIVEPRRMARRLAVDQPVGTARIEPQDPVADRLRPHAPDPRRVRPPAPVVNLGKSQKPTPLGGVLRRLLSASKGPAASTPARQNRLVAQSQPPRRTLLGRSP